MYAKTIETPAQQLSTQSRTIQANRWSWLVYLLYISALCAGVSLLSPYALDWIAKLSILLEESIGYMPTSIIRIFLIPLSIKLELGLVHIGFMGFFRLGKRVLTSK
jgi:hypothetical protein